MIITVHGVTKEGEGTMFSFFAERTEITENGDIRLAAQGDRCLVRNADGSGWTAQGDFEIGTRNARWTSLNIC